MGRKALGRGLSALIPDMDEPLEGGHAGQHVLEIKVEEITPNPHQPRTEFDPEQIEALKRSILEKGVIQPIAVRELGDGYQLLAGERRLRAVRSADMATIPAIVMDVSSEEEMMEISLIENIQREDLNAIEEARAYRAMMDRFRLTQEEVAKKVGKDRSTVTNLLRLLRLPSEVQDRLYDGDISMGHARALLTIGDEKLQIELCEETIKEGLSVRKVEQLARARSTGRRSKTGPKRARSSEDPLLVSLKEELQRILGTAVKIVTRGRRGKIEIEFYSEDDLGRIIEVLKGEAGG